MYGSSTPSPGFPEAYLPRTPAQVAVLELIRDDADDLKWSYISPPVMLEPGERTGAPPSQGCGSS